MSALAPGGGLPHFGSVVDPLAQRLEMDLSLCLNTLHCTSDSYYGGNHWRPLEEGWKGAKTLEEKNTPQWS